MLIYVADSKSFCQVIFLALDAQVKNIVATYSLEHKAIDDNFKSIFHFLDLLMNKTEDIPKTFQNLLICISTIQEIICQHMLKEEKQVSINYLSFMYSDLENLYTWTFFFFLVQVEMEIDSLRTIFSSRLWNGFTS